MHQCRPIHLSSTSHGSKVTSPDQTSFPVLFIGDVKINHNLYLTDVLYVPQFRFNLLSVSALTTSSPTTFTFSCDHFIIQNSTQKRLIGKGERIGDLYILNHRSTDNETLTTETTISINRVDADLWHFRLGHLSTRLLLTMVDKLHCNVSRIHNKQPCYVCPLAKQRKLSFISHNNMSASPFDLIHCDIWGPYCEMSYSGHRFFVTLVDDCTRFTWVYLLKQKSDVSSIIPRFFNMVKTQFDKIIKVFRSDNARELAFTDFFHNEGVLHQFSCVDRPQQNSVVERKHQHLLNVARALFFQSQVPISHWTECVHTATFS